ncbi:MAG: hypothetical protein JWQ71_4096 [Pedosphaera sp.]|nr:hypothetical protein [Pedosphaera sp.]
MLISGQAERWAYPYRMEIISDTGTLRCRAEVVASKMEFLLEDLLNKEKWRCRAERRPGFWGWLIDPFLILYPETGIPYRFILRKSGWMRMEVQLGDTIANLSLKRRQIVPDLGLELVLDRKKFVATFQKELPHGVPIQAAVGVLYFVWLRWAVMSES